MLVLSRKVGERILIGDQISVTVVRINANSVRIGIDAPPAMAVIRDELAQRMEADALAKSAANETTPAEIGEAEAAQPGQQSPPDNGDAYLSRPTARA